MTLWFEARHSSSASGASKASRILLVDGGQHYGHVEVNIEPGTNGQLQAQLEPVYIFPLLDADGAVLGFERRVYDDVTVIITHRSDKAASE